MDPSKGLGTGSKEDSLFRILLAHGVSSLVWLSFPPVLNRALRMPKSTAHGGLLKSSGSCFGDGFMGINLLNITQQEQGLV